MYVCVYIYIYIYINEDSKTANKKLLNSVLNTSTGMKHKYQIHGRYESVLRSMSYL